MATELIVIRHGETDWNAVGRIQGHLAVPLNARGHQQAEALARSFDGQAFEALYSSDLLRAMQTAHAIARQTGHIICADVRLREWDLGVLAGLLPAEARVKYPDALAIYRDNRVDDPVPGGESIRQRYQRVTACLEDLAARHTGKCIAVVTHGGPLEDCYCRAMDRPLDVGCDAERYNAGRNIFSIHGSEWTIKTWGDIAHLKQIGTLGDWAERG